MGTFCAEKICLLFNFVISASEFTASLNLPKNHLFKNGSRTQKDNYRPIIFLSIVANHFDNILSKHCLLWMIEKWKIAANNKKVFRSNPHWLVQDIHLHLPRSSHCKITCLSTFLALKLGCRIISATASRGDVTP